MLPDSLISLVAFLLLIAPGLLFDILSARRRAVRKDSAFTEVSRIVLWSLLFGAVSLGIVSLLSLALPDVVFEITSVVSRESGYSGEDRLRLAWTVVAMAALACGQAYALHRWLMRGRRPLRLVSVWEKILKDDIPKTDSCYVRVGLSSGESFAGIVTDFAADIETGDRELVLGLPIVYWSSSGTKKLLTPVWQRVVIHEREVRWITVQSVRRPDLPGRAMPAPDASAPQTGAATEGVL